MNIKKTGKAAVLLLIAPVLFSITSISQVKESGLVFSEVYLDKENPGNNWLEVYNPTPDTLVFSGYRTSNVYTMNVLPLCENPDSCFTIIPGGCIILCADIDRFQSNWGKDISAYGTSSLKYLAEGGFIFVRTKGCEDSNVDEFRYGLAAMSERVKDKFGTQILLISSEGRSYIRQFSEEKGKIVAGKFTDSNPTPGYHAK